jgi:hypothetical protein
MQLALQTIKRSRMCQYGRLKVMELTSLRQRIYNIHTSSHFAGRRPTKKDKINLFFSFTIYDESSEVEVRCTKTDVRCNVRLFRFCERALTLEAILADIQLCGNYDSWKLSVDKCTELYWLARRLLLKVLMIYNDACMPILGLHNARPASAARNNVRFDTSGIHAQTSDNLARVKQFKLFIEDSRAVYHTRMILSGFWPGDGDVALLRWNYG